MAPMLPPRRMHPRSATTRSRAAVAGLAAMVAAGAVVVPAAAAGSPQLRPASIAGGSALPPPPPGPAPVTEIPPSHHGSPGDASNDPIGLDGTTADAATATCYETCSVRTELTDALVEVTAVEEPGSPGAASFGAASVGGRDRAVLFATRNGGDTKPDCPGYRESFTDWVQFGFQDPARGAIYRKIATFTLHRRLSRTAAAAEARRLQICFEAPYRFTNRPGYRVEQQGSVFAGVLPQCPTLIRGQIPADAATPCVSDRQVVRSGDGWVVRITFRIPASRQDPKALG
jgi:hypothetical protein